MLAFAVLDNLLSDDSENVWFGHLSSHGYLQHIVDSLFQDDDTLRTMLSPQPEPLRPLYIFQSKIVCLRCLFNGSNTSSTSTILGLKHTFSLVLSLLRLSLSLYIYIYIYISS